MTKSRRNWYIPTRVGKTPRRSHTMYADTVHPHTRGENDFESRKMYSWLGTSPHAWGKRRYCHCHKPCRFGTSPHAWGKLLPLTGQAIRGRYIPTRVGKTVANYVEVFANPGTSPHAWGKRRRVYFGAAKEPVHPHTRGENAPISVLRSSLAGTSPHAWGKRAIPPSAPVSCRYIPTRVGKTTPPTLSRLPLPVHPHTRGENKFGLGFAQFLGRYIPTRVGKTSPGSEFRSRQPVHPHTRGENFSRLCLAFAVVGTSPHAWGKH